MIYVLIALAAIVVLFVIVVATRPTAFRVERSAVMNAPAEACFEQVNDFHNWDAWSPWNKFDPNAQHSIEGPPSGVGAVMKWSGNNKIGEGISTIIESRRGEFVRLNLRFIRPMKATNLGEFTFKPTSPDHTTVTWSMTGRNGFMAKAFHMLIDCDKMIGTEFENGLASMKKMVEASPSRVAPVAV